MKHLRRFLLCGTLACILAGCNNSPEEVLMESAVMVEAREVATGNLTLWETYIADISSDNSVSIVAQVSATAESIPVSVGDSVTAGQVLCVFDSKAAQLDLRNAEISYQNLLDSFGATDRGALAVLEGKVQIAEKNYHDSLALQQIGGMAQNEITELKQALNSAQAELKAARSSVEAARLKISIAEHQLNFYTLTAPIAGTIESIHISENNLVSSGTEAFTIASSDNKTATFYVTREISQEMKRGQEVTVENQGEEYAGTISEVGLAVDPVTGLFKIKADLYGAENLPNGSVASLKLAAHTVENSVLIPTSALYFDEGEPFVYRIIDQVAVKTPVTMGIYSISETSIESGLQPGDVIVTSWAARLKDGVTVHTASDPGQPVTAEEN